MNIYSYLNDFTVSMLVLGIIIYGTKLINYYYNFFHIYNYLDYEQKMGYFKSNYLVNIVSKHPIIKKIIVYYFLIPLIKMNYLFISIFITMLYSLCYFEFKKILDEQCKKSKKNKKNKKKTYDLILSETSATNDLFDLSNLNNCKSPIEPITNSSNNTNILQDDKNEIKNVEQIGTDYDNGILNIMEFISSTNSQCENNNDAINNNTDDANDINDADTNLLSVNESGRSILNNLSKISLANNNCELNLLNEINLLKTNSSSDKNINVQDVKPLDYNNLTHNENFVQEIKNEDNDINEYLVMDNEKNQSNNITASDYKNFINDDKILDNVEANDTINFDEIDFGDKIEELKIDKLNNDSLNLNKLNKSDTVEKKIIKIGKKKRK